MKKRKSKQQPDPRLQTAPGHFLKNAPWRRDEIKEVDPRMISARDSVVLAFLIVSSIVVAAALWMNPPHLIRFQTHHEAIKAQATLAGNRVPRPYNGLDYDPAKFEEVKDDDPIVQDDLEDILLEDATEAKPRQTL
jgi:hypothetical protein